MSKSTRKNNVALLELHHVYDESNNGFEETRKVYCDFYNKSTNVLLSLVFLGDSVKCFKNNSVGQWYRCNAVSKICYQKSQADDLSRDIDLSDPYREALHEDLNARQWNADNYKPVDFDGVNPFWYQALYGANIALDFYNLPALSYFQPSAIGWMLGGKGIVESFTIKKLEEQADARVKADMKAGRVDVNDFEKHKVLSAHYLDEGLFAARAEAIFRRQNVLNAYNYACDYDGEAEALKAIEEGYEGTTWEELRDQYILGIATHVSEKLKMARTRLLTKLSCPLMGFQRTQFETSLNYIEEILVQYTGSVDGTINPKEAEIEAAMQRLKEARRSGIAC